MAERTRAFDWSQTPVGPIEQWPDTLLVTVNTLLHSRHPMFLWWGEELTQFYNDGYRPSLREDKHPQALGQAGHACWPEIWHVIGPQIDAVMTRGEANWFEDQMVPINRHGRLEEVYWTYGYSPVRDPEGAIRGTLVVCTETTNRVLAERRLQAERAQLSSLFEQAPAFFTLLRGPEFVFELVNPLYQQLIGDRAVLGKTVREAVPEAEGQGFIALLENVYRTGEPFVGSNTPIRLARRANEALELRYLDFVYQPMRDENGVVTGIIALGVDVTESRRAQQVLLQSEKLIAVGRLASSIAHEINNPLEAVTNLLFLAKESAVSTPTRQYLETAEAELHRVSAITSQTLRFYRQTTNPRPVAASELMDATMLLYRGRLNNSTIEVKRRDREAPPVVCFDGEIRQVLSNLVSNAVDAMLSKGGRLLVRSRPGMHWRSGRTGVVLTIADTGTGMSQHTMTHIFEPFYTTKEIGGTGLGLWISDEIVQRHQGSIKVRSTPGRGTVFQLFLPLKAAETIR